MIVVPTETPVTSPPATVAIPGAELVQVPPAGVPVNVVDPGKHILVVPVTTGVVPTVNGT